MPASPSRLGIPRPAGTDLIKDGDNAIRDAIDAIDALIPMRKKFNAPAAESRTNAAYGLLGTPDRVQGIIVPDGGLLRIAYRAMWKEAVLGAARAAIFIGTDQLKTYRSGQANPEIQEAEAATPASGEATDTYRPLRAFDLGLAGLQDTPAYGGEVSTGQTLGVQVGDSGGLRWRVGAAAYTSAKVEVLGGVCEVEVDPGTYAVSVQFKASSGAVTVNNRRLWVEAVPFT